MSSPLSSHLQFHITKAVMTTVLVFLFFSCGNKKKEELPLTLKNLSCKPAERTFSFDEVVYEGQKGSGRIHFTDIKNNIYSTCMNCHLAPSNSGGFTFIDSYQGEVRTIAGQTQFYPGYFEIAETVLKYITHPDEKLRMPPEDRRQKNPELFEKLAQHLQAWIKNNKINGSFNLDSTENPVNIRPPMIRSSDQGECTPNSSVVGSDYRLDRYFENTQSLPKDLSETDLFTLDSYQLAQKGTLAYNVEYPLWADNNGKGRWFHLPVKKTLFGFKQQKIQYNSTTQTFDIPDNTRFYKTFYKKVKQRNGKIRYRRVETRLIVARTPWDKSLFGTYKWDETEQTATLVETPYRDGTSFKDTLLKVTVDEEKLTQRDYAIPAKHRCIECHMGSKGNNTVLGFTPLQLNRRDTDENGDIKFISEADRTQVERFIDYGLIQDAPPVSEWPRLESIGQLKARNKFELKAQGYVYGNCAHCHNPNGLAFTKENGITLDLTEGSLFQFNTKTRSTQIPTRLIVHQNGDLDQSHIWRKISDSSAQLGMTSQMPMNTGATPDCQALRAIGKWIKSFESLDAAEKWEPSCKKENEFKWIDQDFTVSEDPKNYIPRRADWKDLKTGMPQKYRDLSISDELESAFKKEYAVGYWSKKEACSFPEKNLTADEIRPWMMKGSQPKRPFGELYYTTPGSWYYRTSCMKCHGPKADGDSALARGILNWSGGGIRVANFMSGMFGDKNENLKKFITGEQSKNLAPNYLVWMAMEGTRVQFPPELSSFLGKHGGQMLNQMREKCINQISLQKPSSPQFMDHEIFEKVCFVNNRSKSDPLLASDPATGKPLYPEIFEEWADHAAYNIGFSIFDFLKSMSDGKLLPGNDQCEIIYPKK